MDFSKWTLKTLNFSQDVNDTQSTYRLLIYKPKYTLIYSLIAILQIVDWKNE